MTTNELIQFLGTKGWEISRKKVYDDTGFEHKLIGWHVTGKRGEEVREYDGAWLAPLLERFLK